MTTGVTIDDSLASIDIAFDEDMTLPKYNLFGGEDLKTALLPYRTNPSISPEEVQIRNDEKYIQITTESSGFHNGVLFSGPFKPNTQYTILLCMENYLDRQYPCFRVKYTDNSYSNIGHSTASSHTKTNYRTITDAGKTVSAIVGFKDLTYYSNYCYIYYEKCGIFEGTSTNWDSFSLGTPLFKINSSLVGLEIPSMDISSGDVISARADGSVTLTHNNLISSIGAWKVPSLTEAKTVTSNNIGNVFVKSYIGIIKSIAKDLRNEQLRLSTVETDLSKKVEYVRAYNDLLSPPSISNGLLTLTTAGVSSSDGGSFIRINGNNVRILRENSAGLQIEDYFVKAQNYNSYVSENNAEIKNLKRENARLWEKINLLVSQLEEQGLEIDISDPEPEEPQESQTSVTITDGVIYLGGNIDSDGILITDLSLDENGYLYSGSGSNLTTIDENGILSLGTTVNSDGILLTDLSVNNDGYLTSGNNSNNSVTMDNNGIVSLGGSIDNNGVLLTQLTPDNNGVLTS